MKTQSPSKAADQFVVRLPLGMRERIAEAARAGSRSMNSEIVARLEKSFNPISDEGDVLQAVRAISEYSAQFDTVVSVQFSRSPASTLAAAIDNQSLPPDATVADLETQGSAMVQLHAERSAKSK